ncbi:MAG TPA: hypothetical protein VMX96_02900 [Dehalococcoidia bacterium]|nr:hypothetical protein [Dehalococcoidia bacterium]
MPFITIRLFMILFVSSIILVAALADKPSVTALLVDYYESFHSVSLYTYDSDSDGYDDSLTLSVDVNTDGGYVDVTVYGDLEDSYGFLVDSDSATWSIYGSDYEYGYLYLTASSGDPGYYSYYLDLYDDLAYWEDSWSDSVYLYPLGYGGASDYYESFYSVSPSTYDSDSDGYDDSVTLTVDVDTDGGYVDVTIYGDLEDSYGFLVDSDSATWSIYGSDSEYGYLYLTASSGDPGYYSYYLDLYDDLAYWEDSWSNSIYLYPLGYGGTSDYNEYFNSVSPSTSDSDSDGYDDSVTLTIDVDTTGSSAYVTIYGDLEDSYGFLVDSDSATWSIYGSGSEYGYLYLIASSGDPGYYSYQLELYDNLAYWEDSWSGSVYLYPLGYGGVSDYNEYFNSVSPSTYDSDSDGYDDSVTLTIDVDTTGSSAYVTVYANIYDTLAQLVHSESTSWSIYGSDSEYGYLDLTATTGYPGLYGYQLALYDASSNSEDDWIGTVDLYPLGYGGTTITTPTPSPDGGGLGGGAVAGIVVGALIVTVPGFFWANKSTKRRRATNAQIRELKTQMELWREEGYDVSELEDLFK